ncbi:hypothetical protein GCM10028774_41750 [Spirosoma jeollabukense]
MSAGARAGFHPHLVRDDTYGFVLTGDRTRTVIPFEFRSNLIIISARVNESDSLRFIVDTGVSYTIITNAKGIAQPLRPVVRQIKLTGVGEGNSIMASITIGNKIYLNGLQDNHHTLVYLTEDLMRLSENAGVPIHGILGYELFANLVVTIDFQRQEITCIQPQHYHYRRRKGDRYPLFITDRKAFTNALSVFDGTAFVPLRVVLDTGAGQALLLDRFQQAVSIPIPNKVLQVELGRGLNGFITGELGRLDRVRLGRSELTNVLASFPDRSTYNQKVAELPARQGSIGCELLRRFRVTFNYPEHYFVLKPVNRLLREPFEHDMSGLELRAGGQDFHRYFINLIMANSPAERAGLRVGDELIGVNNYLNQTLRLSTLTQLFRAGAGKPIRLLIRRGGQLYQIDFLLKRLI